MSFLSILVTKDTLEVIVISTAILLLFFSNSLFLVFYCWKVALTDFIFNYYFIILLLVDQDNLKLISESK